VHDDTEVRLALPAAPEFVRLARLTVAGIAGRMGFTHDEVEELRIAVDELCLTIVGPMACEGSIELRYWIDADDLVVEGVGTSAAPLAAAPSLSPLSRQILSAVVDEHDVAAGALGPTFRIRKRRATG
jgi:serine/threonine-protein kinase RsbW